MLKIPVVKRNLIFSCCEYQKPTINDEVMEILTGGHFNVDDFDKFRVNLKKEKLKWIGIFDTYWI